MSTAGRNLLVVVSAPSGAGKTTLCERLLANQPGMIRSVSCTTRAPRGQEREGRDYHFLSAGEFNRRVEAGQFLEHATVHGNQYGTLRSTVEEGLESGKDVLLVIDVQGAASVRRAVREGGGRLHHAFVDIFVSPPSLEVLRNRLLKRGEDGLEVIERRLANARGEIERSGEFRYHLVNDDLQVAASELCAIIQAEHARGPC